MIFVGFLYGTGRHGDGEVLQWNMDICFLNRWKMQVMKLGSAGDDFCSPLPTNPWKIKVFGHIKNMIYQQKPSKYVGFGGRKTPGTNCPNPMAPRGPRSVPLPPSWLQEPWHLRWKEKNWERRWEILENPWLLKTIGFPWKRPAFIHPGYFCEIRTLKGVGWEEPVLLRGLVFLFGSLDLDINFISSVLS